MSSVRERGSVPGWLPDEVASAAHENLDHDRGRPLRHDRRRPAPHQASRRGAAPPKRARGALGRHAARDHHQAPGVAQLAGLDVDAQTITIIDNEVRVLVPDTEIDAAPHALEPLRVSELVEVRAASRHSPSCSSRNRSR
jgi:hypothetical protein